MCKTDCEISKFVFDAVCVPEYDDEVVEVVT